MIPQLPVGSNIRIAPVQDGYEVTRTSPIGGRSGRFFLAGFLFLWLIGWALGEWDTLKDVADTRIRWSEKAFPAFWLLGWTICGGWVTLYLIGILRKPRPVRLAIEPSRLVRTPPYTWMTRLNGSTNMTRSFAGSTPCSNYGQAPGYGLIERSASC
jgi:hypothetical protein